MKVKRFLLSLIMVFSCLCFVACNKDESDDNDNGNAPVLEKQEPTIVVNYSLSEDLDALYVGTKLSDIHIFTVGSGTKGKIDWVNDDYELVLGKNTCNWIFTPTDTETYKSKSGSIELTAVRKLLDPEVSDVKLEGDQTLYYGVELKDIKISQDFVAEYQGTKVEGTIVWVNPSEKTVQGEHEYTCKFIPTKSDEFAEVTKTLSFNASVKPAIESVSAYSKEYGKYVAFDEYTLNVSKLKFNLKGGTVVDVDIKSIDCELLGFIDEKGEFKKTSDRENFRQGDKAIRVRYKYNGSDYDVVNNTFEFDIELSNVVGYKGVDIPVYNSEVSYDGGEHIFRIDNTSLYTCVEDRGIDAGIYYPSLTLVDTKNYKWKDTNGNLLDDVTIEIDCEILKAEQTVTNNGSEGIEYSGEGHQAVITSNGAAEIYYSKTQLTSTNYSTAGASSIEFTNAGTYKVYYYAVGNNNYNDLADSFNFTINRQTPTMNLDFCYTLITGNAVVYPDDYVTVKNQKGDDIDKGHLSKTYWQVYALNEDVDNPNKQTDVSNSGAEIAGAAPKNHRDGGYVVVVVYPGSTNYMPVTGLATLYIEDANLGLFAEGDESEFAFKENANADISTLHNYSIIGTKEECNNYVKFEKMPADKYGLIGISYISKFGAGDESKSSGRLVYSDGSYQLLDAGGALFSLEIDNGSLEIDFSEGDPVTLGKWVIPSYVDMKFKAKTLDDTTFTEGKNESYYSEIRFYNDYGTIRFEAKFELKYVSGGIPKGGLVTWSGIASAELSTFEDVSGTAENIKGNCVIVGCYNEGTDTRSFKVWWPVGELNNPSKINIYQTTNYSSELLNVDFYRV